MSESPDNPFPVVGIGSSAGGLQPLTELLGALPPNPGLALVVIQHLSPHAESHLPSLLQRHTALKVVEAVHGGKVAPDTVFVIQPNTTVAIADGVLSVTPRASETNPTYPIDHFLRSLVAVQGSLCAGVILSGTGSDGTLGMCEVKAAGGVTFAQDDSAEHHSMPRSAVASGAVDLVLSPAEIGAKLAELPRHPYIAAPVVLDAVDENAEFQQVITALRTSSGVDFSHYRDTTIKRRTARRMLLHGIRSTSEYAQLVTRDQTEAEALYRDVLINVTSFFREPEMFDALKQQVLPALVSAKADGQPIRAWTAGCSTGQETYSIAITLLEYLQSIGSKREVQIFATDLGDPGTLDRARAGIYPESIEAEVSPERLRQFFVKQDRHYRIQKSVRDLCVFARQNLTVDPPFSRVDLVTCRNVMIYMSSSLQERLLPIFHFALNRPGFLVLGISESIGRFGDLFEAVDAPRRIFRKKEGSQRPTLAFASSSWLSGITPRTGVSPAQSLSDFDRAADRLLLSRYAPPSVLIDQDFEIQQFRGKTSAFLEAPAGQPTANLLRMVKQGLLMELRSALSEAKASRTPVSREGMHVFDGGERVEFTLRVLPVNVGQFGDFRLLVLFEPAGAARWSVPAGSADDRVADRDADWLREELAAAKHHLQAIVDDHAAADQELRAAHEEVLSSNEELQSTNEELETTKEELQSANEELTTVNEQFQSRNRDLDALTDELSNFIASADVPMVTVGRNLLIRQLTPAAQRAFNLLPSDVGRSIEHLKFAFDVPDLGATIDQVITSMQPWQTDTLDRDGRWWLLRVRPFVTSDQRIDGATLIAVDIDSVRRHRELVEARDYAMAVVQAVREPLVVLDADCRVGLANDAFYRLFGVAAEEVQDRPIWDSATTFWDGGGLRDQLRHACRGDGAIEALEIRRVEPSGEARVYVLNGHGVNREGQSRLFLLSIEDVTAARRAEELRIDAETLRMIDRRKDEFLGILAHELRNPLAPMRFALELLRRGRPDAPEGARARQVLERQVAHLVRIVDDLLDVSRIAQGKIELRVEAVPLHEVVEGAIELTRPAVDAAGHKLTVSLPDEPVVLSGDRIRLTQVIVNLLNNAVKFTPDAGHISLVAETAGERPGVLDQLRIRVRDTGIGIDPELRGHVFDMFMQGDRTLERSRGGLGVGLTLVRKLVGLHRGTVEVRSEGVGRGSEFIVVLPLEAAAQPVASAQAAPASVHRRPLRILVADDNDDGRHMLSFLLGGEGHTVETAADGQEALDAITRLRPDVAILDIGMPGMNGYTVAEMLARERLARPRLLIALSGLGQTDDKERAVKAGFDHHFTKPVEISTLSALLADLARSPGSSTTS